MNREKFEAALKRLADQGELGIVCPFSDVPIEMDGKCLNYEHCRWCQWFGFDSRENRGFVDLPAWGGGSDEPQEPPE